MACHHDVLNAARAVVRRKGVNAFSPQEVIDEMKRTGTYNRYQESTIRTHITSRCCDNAPNHHAVTYKYFRCVSYGVYELI